VLCGIVYVSEQSRWVEVAAVSSVMTRKQHNEEHEGGPSNANIATSVIEVFAARLYTKYFVFFEDFYA
jgi:hypothetical protein